MYMTELLPPELALIIAEALMEVNLLSMDGISTENYQISQHRSQKLL